MRTQGEVRAPAEDGVRWELAPARHPQVDLREAGTERNVVPGREDPGHILPHGGAPEHLHGVEHQERV
eukprot:11525853-Alexandrium_andersonii.AAC.1